MDPVFLAQSRLRRRKYDECIAMCTDILNENPYDQAVWYLKAQALTEKNYVDDTEMEDEGAGDMLLDEHGISQAPRPGTSLRRPESSSSQQMRPVSSSGRPVTGFARPGTSSRPTTGADLERVLTGQRVGTAASRPVTSGGRLVRLGTASMLMEPGGPFINVDKLDLRKYATRPALAKVLCDYILYHDHNPKKALELCALATVHAEYKDWWWKARLGKCYYQLGLLRDAEKQFKSAIKQCPMLETYHELAKVHIKMDQPAVVLDLYMRAMEKFPLDAGLVIGVARIQEMLGKEEQALEFYKKALRLDNSNVECVACLASFYFYSDQPEVAMRYFRRLLQMGVNNTEIWNNLALCTFYASQYDMTLNCFDRAFQFADDSNMADVWYNVGQAAIGVGDLGLAYQAFKISISCDNSHSESYSNLGVLELRKNNLDQARSNFLQAIQLNPFIFEPVFNAALLAYKLGEFQESYQLVEKALGIFPEHSESKELMRLLREHFSHH